MTDILRVEIGEKWTVVQEQDGSMYGLRYGHMVPIAENLLLAMAYEIDSLRTQRTDLLAACEAALRIFELGALVTNADPNKSVIITELRAARDKAKL